MLKNKNMYLSSIILFSEIIWLYYVIVIFSRTVGDAPIFFDFTWLIIAGVMGYTMNVLLENKSNDIVKVVINVLVLGVLVLQNWKGVVPQSDGLGFGVGVSIGLVMVYGRSIQLTQRQPKREEVLYHFEGNILFYIVFAVILTLSKWSDGKFHLVFMYTILASLLGMVLTLQNTEDVGENSIIQVMKVGNPGWFAGIIAALLMSIPVFSLLLMIPSVGKVLQLVGVWIVQGLVWVLSKVYQAYIWLASLLPHSETVRRGGTFKERDALTSRGVEGGFTTVSHTWILVGITILLIVACIWYLSTLIKNRQQPNTIKPNHIIIYREAWWKMLGRKLKSLLKYFKINILMKYAAFYYQPVYWYYHQVIRWGKKNGLPKLSSETSKEYIHKVIRNLPEKQINFTHKDKCYHVVELLKTLNEDYQQTYYGLEMAILQEAEYKLLIHHLKHIQIKK